MVLITRKHLSPNQLNPLQTSLKVTQCKCLIKYIIESTTQSLQIKRKSYKNFRDVISTNSIWIILREN